MKLGNIITFIIGTIAFALPIILFNDPPTDTDGGPMMAYNLLYFYPIAFLSFILSFIVFFRLKYVKGNILYRILLILLTIPSILLSLILMLNFIQILNEPNLDHIEIPRNTFLLTVNDSLDIRLSGFTYIPQKDGENSVEMKEINMIPFINNEYSFKDGGEFSGNFKDFELLYEIRNDSLILYPYKGEFEYFNKTRIPLPFQVKDYSSIAGLNEQEVLERKIYRFDWKLSQ